MYSHYTTATNTDSMKVVMRAYGSFQVFSMSCAGWNAHLSFSDRVTDSVLRNALSKSVCAPTDFA